MNIIAQQQRTNELFEAVKESNSLMELLTKFYQHRPLHASADHDELTLTIKLRPNKFVRRNVGKNVNIVDSQVELLVTCNGDAEVIERIYGHGTDDSVSNSIQDAISKLTRPVDITKAFDLTSEVL